MKAIDLETRYSAHNYAPLPVVLARGEGAYLWDTSGRCYVDMMSAYSAASHGHAHPRILAALEAQAKRLAVPSRAYYNDRLGPFLEELCKLTGLDAALPMNTGAEAVETAIKAARRWGYRVKGIARDRAEIIVASGNFHGRTTTVISFSSEPDYRDGFGPFTPGFRAVPFGDHAANRRRAGRADPRRGRHHRAAGGLADRTAPHLRRAQRPPHPRRSAVRPRPHRRLVRVPARRHPPGRADPGQGARRWRAAGLRLRRQARGHGRVHAGLARLDLRRQSARRSGGARSAPRHPRRRPGREEPRARRPHAAAPERDGKPGARANSRPRPLGRRRDRSRHRQRTRDLRAAVGKRRALEGNAPHGRAPGAAARHRSGRAGLGARSFRGGPARARRHAPAPGRGLNRGKIHMNTLDRRRAHFL